MSLFKKSIFELPSFRNLLSKFSGMNSFSVCYNVFIATLFPWRFAFHLYWQKATGFVQFHITSETGVAKVLSGLLRAE